VYLHLEIARYQIDQDFLSRAKIELTKSLEIDYSVALKSVQADLKEEDDPNDLQRPFDKGIKLILKKLILKTNIYGEPDSVQD